MKTALISLVLLVAASTARAQDAVPVAEATEETGTPVPAEATAAVVPEDAVVERQPDATAIIEVRRLTPILPEVSADEDGPRNAYQLYWELDIPVLIGGAALAAARIWRTGANTERAQCLIDYGEDGIVRTRDHCDPDDLNAFDRIVAGRYDPMWGTVSDYTLLAVSLAPIPLLWAEEGFLPMLNDMVVVYQSALLAIAFSGMATLTGGRARPFVYGQEAPIEERTGGNAGLSFISSHTSFSFAAATATFWTLERRRGLDGLTIAVGLIGEGAAALVAIARVMAGSHFPTDVIMGALVGMGMGTLVPTLHGSPVRIAGSAGKDHAMGQLEVAF